MSQVQRMAELHAKTAEFVQACKEKDMDLAAAMRTFLEIAVERFVHPDTTAVQQHNLLLNLPVAAEEVIVYWLNDSKSKGEAE